MQSAISTLGNEFETSWMGLEQMAWYVILTLTQTQTLSLTLNLIASPPPPPPPKQI